MSRTLLPTIPVCALASALLASAVAAATPASASAPMPLSERNSTAAGPVQSSWIGAKLLTLAQPELMPPGVNDYACRSAAHPRPVVLVHGTFANAYDSFSAMAPALKAEGFCVFTLDYGRSDAPVGKIPGVFGTAPVRSSIAELSTFVDGVLARTSASKIDLFGWSQGGLVANGYVKFGGGADAAEPSKNKVANVVSFGSPNAGTTASGLLPLQKAFGLDAYTVAGLGAAIADFEVGSSFLHELTDGGIPMPGVSYTAVVSRYDEVVTPYQSGFLTPKAGSNVTDVTLQDGCGWDMSDHLQGPYSPRLISIVAKAMGGTQPIVCTPRLPVL